MCKGEGYVQGDGIKEREQRKNDIDVVGGVRHSGHHMEACELDSLIG